MAVIKGVCVVFATPPPPYFEERGCDYKPRLFQSPGLIYGRATHKIYRLFITLLLKNLTNSEQNNVYGSGTEMIDMRFK